MALNTLSVNDEIYQVLLLLGRGKSGYSYLVSKNEKYFVI